MKNVKNDNDQKVNNVIRNIRLQKAGSFLFFCVCNRKHFFLAHFRYFHFDDSIKRNSYLPIFLCFIQPRQQQMRIYYSMRRISMNSFTKGKNFLAACATTINDDDNEEEKSVKRKERKKKQYASHTFALTFLNLRSHIFRFIFSCCAFSFRSHTLACLALLQFSFLDAAAAAVYIRLYCVYVGTQTRQAGRVNVYVCIYTYLYPLSCRKRKL